MPTTPIQSNDRPNPYVGPRPFTEEEKLYGRESEIQDLMNLFIAERILLLHSPSGAGKTSLIQSGLVPKLKDQKIGKDPQRVEKFYVRSVIRVNQEPSAKIKKSPGYNRYLFSMLSSLESAFDKKDDQIPDAELVSMSLSDYLERRAKPKEVLYDVLIFDQFEEVLTSDPTDLEAKREFFKQVGKILEDRKRWALFVIREDFLASFDPYLFWIPTRFSNRFRLDFLGEKAAYQAIQNPVKQVGVEFTDNAASQLINNLRQVKIQSPDGTMTEQLGPYVEPVQLQVVCFRLWQKLAPDDQTIDEDDLSSVGDVNQSLAEYYTDQVFEVASKLKVDELVVRKWFNDKLITEGGIRSQVLMEVDVSAGLPNQAIFLFVDAHLVRAEKRRGLTWFELAHDRLVEPVRNDNSTWFANNLSPLQRQAALWKEGRRSDYLLHGKALEDAKDWAEAHDEILSTDEREFLDACLTAQAIEDAERKAKAMRLRQIIIVSILVAMIMALAASFSLVQRRTAIIERQTAVIAMEAAETSQGFAQQQQDIAQQQANTAEAARNSISTLVANPAVAQETNVSQVTEPLTVEIKKVSINGGDNSETVVPGQKLSISIEYSILDEACPYCFDVIQLGFDGEDPLECIYQGVPGAEGFSGKAEIEIDAPTVPSEYSLKFDSARNYSCPVDWSSNLSSDVNKQIASINIEEELPGGTDKVAFLAGKNVWVMNLDGSDLQQLTQDGGIKHNLQWHPDGNSIFYISGKCVNQVNLISGKVVTLFCFLNADDIDAFQISPDGSQVAVSVYYQLHIVPFNLDDLKSVDRLSRLSDMATCSYNTDNKAAAVKDVRWSKDGNRIAMIFLGSNARGNFQDLIQVMEICSWKRVDEFPGDRFAFNYSNSFEIPDFDWDGNSIFLLNNFERNGGFGNMYEYNMQSYQGKIVNPINGSCCYRDARWSPDGSYVFFAFQDINQGIQSQTQLYYAPYGTLGTRGVFTPVSLPPDFLFESNEMIQPALRPVFP